MSEFGHILVLWLKSQNEKILQSLPKVHNMFLGINPLSIIQIRGVTLFRLYNMLFYMSSTYYLHTYIKYSKVKIKDLKIWFCCWTCWSIRYCSLWCFFRLYSVLPIITTYPNLRFFFKNFVPRYLYYYVHIQKAMNKYCTIAELFTLMRDHEGLIAASLQFRLVEKCLKI